VGDEHYAIAQRVKGSCSAIRTCRTSSPSWASTSFPTTTSCGVRAANCNASFRSLPRGRAVHRHAGQVREAGRTIKGFKRLWTAAERFRSRRSGCRDHRGRAGGAEQLKARRNGGRYGRHVSAGSGHARAAAVNDRSRSADPAANGYWASCRGTPRCWPSWARRIELRGGGRRRR